MLEYVAISSGMAFAGSCYLVLGVLAQASSPARLAAPILVAALLCWSVAVAVGELSSRFPSAPGVRTYLKRAFGDGTSLFFTYLVIAIVPVIGALELTVFMDAAWPGGPPWMRACIAVALVGALGWTHSRGRDLPEAVQIVTLVGLVVGTFGVSSLTLARPAPLHELLPAGTERGFVESVGLAFFLFVGVEWGASAAKSVDAARRIVPASMGWSLVLLLVTYLVFGLSLQRALPRPLLSGTTVPHIVMGQHFLGLPGALVMRLLSLLALLTTLNAGVLAASRLVYGLAREERLLPVLNAPLRCLNERGVPYAAVVFLCVPVVGIAALLLHAPVAESAARLSAGLYCFVYSALSVAHVKLRRSNSVAPFRGPLPPVIHCGAALIIAGVGLFTVASSADPLLLAALLVVLGLTGALANHTQRALPPTSVRGSQSRKATPCLQTAPARPCQKP